MADLDLSPRSADDDPIVPKRRKRNVLPMIVLALVVPVVTCIAAYLIFLHVFYVPFPKATWWAGLSGA